MPMILSLLLALVAPVPDEFARLAAEGDWAEVERRAAERVVADPGDVEGRTWLGRALLVRGGVLRQGDSFARDLGLASLRRAVDELATASEGRSEAADEARAWASLADYELALADPSSQGDAEARLGARAREGDAYASHLLGRLIAETGRLAEGLPWLEDAARLEPRVEFALAHADALSAAGRRDEALLAWRSASTHPDAWPAEIVEALARILPSRGDAAQREQQLALLLERWPDDPTLAWHRAWTFQQQGRTDEAAAAFAAGAALAVAPEYDRAWAAVLLSAGRHAEAVQRLRPWVLARHWEAYSDLLDVADDLALDRRWDEALDVYEIALGVEDRDERARRNHALTLWRAGRAGAAAAWRGVVEQFPGRADVLNDAALAALAGGRLGEAEQLLEQAVALPGSADARENLAALRVALDRPGDALPLLEDVLRAEPERARSLWLRDRALRAARGGS